jgi:drug/metabolite transporter (DMT)-like permease
MLAGGVVLAVMGAVNGEYGKVDPAIISTESIVAFAYLTVIGSLLAFTVFGWLLRVAPLPLIATYAYVNPVVAVILGAIVLHEPIEPRTLLAGAVIVGAVALIVTARGRMAAPRGEPQPSVTSPRGPSEPHVERAPSRSASG